MSKGIIRTKLWLMFSFFYNWMNSSLFDCHPLVLRYPSLSKVHDVFYSITEYIGALSASHLVSVITLRYKKLNGKKIVWWYVHITSYWGFLDYASEPDRYFTFIPWSWPMKFSCHSQWILLNISSKR